jgi:hypothetical protein
MSLFIDLGCLYCKQTQRAFNVFKNTINWLKIDSIDQELFKIQLTREWELLIRRWNAWHWEPHCVFTAGGERVMQCVSQCQAFQRLMRSSQQCTCMTVYLQKSTGCLINDICKNRGDNPLQDSPVKESAIRLFNGNTTPNTDSTETELTLLKFRLDQNQSCPHRWSRAQSGRILVVSRHNMLLQFRSSLTPYNHSVWC